LINNISSYQKIITKKRGEAEAQIKRKNIIDDKLDELAIRGTAIEEAQVFIQKIASETQSQLKFNLEPVVQVLLDACFPGKYTFVIDFTIERNRTAVRLLYRTKDGHERDPLKQNGGGICDLTAFALRIALWSIGKTDNVIILDEPLKNLQPVELNKLGFEVIKNLSKKLGLQFIIVNNSIGSENLLDVSDKVFQVSMGKDGISKVKEV
jgi:ABC-type phosphate transport system ATPase subunit